MNPPTFSLCYATRRPQCVKTVLDAWMTRADKPEAIEIIVAHDADQQPPEDSRARFVVQRQTPYNCVRAWNLAAQESRGDILVAVSDDFMPPWHWDTAILHASPIGVEVIRVSDGGRSGLCTLPVVWRNWYRSRGFLFYPEYESMFCDTELTAHADQLGRLGDAPGLLFEHLHPTFNTRAADDVDRAHSSNERFRRGQQVFLRRLLDGFDTPQPIPAAEFLPYCALLQVTQNDFCLGEVCARLLAEGVRNFGFCVPNQYWDREPVPEQGPAEVAAVAADLIAHGAHFARVWRDDLWPHFRPGMRRNILETRYRNFCLERVRRLGFDHLLIVDGDELWRPGTLTKLHRAVQFYRPTSACVDGTPLIGHPAVAVDGARDKILLYLGGAEQFRDVRAPEHATLALPLNGVFHFSAVRGSRAKIAAKMRRSGHYDDREYHFEAWINDVLPNLRPGLSNVHMHRDGSLWPLTRAVTAAELTEIPHSLHYSLYNGGDVFSER